MNAAVLRLFVVVASGLLAAGCSASSTTTPVVPEGSSPCGSFSTNTVSFYSDYHPSDTRKPAPTRKPNYYFHEGKVQNLTFAETAFSTSTDTSYSAYVDDNTLNICTDRQNSTTPVTAVQGWMSQDGATWTALNAIALGSFSDRLPEDLNFAVQGTIGFTYPNSSYVWSCNIILAQGHSGLTNNWWMFSMQNLTSSRDFSVLCTLNGGAPFLEQAGPATSDTDNQFMFGSD